ncbi:MAG: DUF4861 domain-containing protein [Staphylococcus sp.]|nr:DUF4861 domain-containing protein [Staphylococcus sp.]
MLALSLLLSLTVTVSNPSPTPREAVPVVVPVGQNGKEINSVTIKGRPDIPWQLDDLNDDGIADELAFLVDLKPNATETYTINLSSAPSTSSFTPGTYAYIRLNDKGKKYPKIQAIAFPGDTDNKQMYGSIYGHGAVLEGLYNAIRVYMDNRQSVDLYTKQTPKLELATTAFYTTRQQLDEGYGRDVLWAGSSVALGSFRGYQQGNPVTIDTVTTRSQRLLTTGPVRSIIEIQDRGWVYNGRPIDMRQRYTVYAGHRDYDVEVKLSGASASDIFCTGIQKLAENNEGFLTPQGLAGSWGENTPDKNMADITDTVGLGIFVASPYLKSVKEDELNYLTLLNPDKNGIIRYSFIAGGKRDTTSPQSADEWFKYLRSWQKEKASPVKIRVK